MSVSKELLERRAKHAQTMREWRAKNPGYAARKAKEYAARHPDRIKANRKRSYEKHKERRRAECRAWHAENKEWTKKYAKKRYDRLRDVILAKSHKIRGIPKALRPRPEFCELCGGPPGKRALHIDHCHERNVFRGWLCFRCNAGLGNLRDSVEILEKAIAYLKRSDGISV